MRKVIFLILIVSTLGTIAFNYFSKKSSRSAVAEFQNKTVEAIPKDEKLLALEKKLLSSPLGSFTAKRNGKELLVTTSSGTSIRYVDKMEKIPGDDTELNYLLEYKTNPEVLVIYKQYYEGSGFTFLLPNGNETPSGHYLYFSPSGHRATQVNYADAYNFDGWAVFEKDDVNYQKVIFQEPARYSNFSRVGLYFEKWVDEDTIQVLMDYMTTQNGESVNLCAPAKIQFVDNIWNLTADLEKSQKECHPVKSLQIPEDIRELVN